MKVERIEWQDAAHVEPGAWVDAKAEANHACRTVGIVVHETDEFVRIAHTLDLDNDNVTGAFDIPKSSIRKRRRLA